MRTFLATAIVTDYRVGYNVVLMLYRYMMVLICRYFELRRDLQCFDGKAIDLLTAAIGMGLRSRELILRACKHPNGTCTSTVRRKCNSSAITSEMARMESGRVNVGILKHHDFPISQHPSKQRVTPLHHSRMHQ
jgi:hypothetical protein